MHKAVTIFVVSFLLASQLLASELKLNEQKAMIAANTYKLLMQFNNIEMREINLQVVTDCFHRTMSRMKSTDVTVVGQGEGVSIPESVVVVINSCIEASVEGDASEEGTPFGMSYTLQRAGTFLNDQMVGIGLRAGDGSIISLISSKEIQPDTSVEGLQLPTTLDPQCLQAKDLQKLSLTTTGNNVKIEQLQEQPQMLGVAQVFGFFSENCSFVGVLRMPQAK